jgi:hypothetical protein
VTFRPNPYLADAAAFELGAREKFYPADIEAGRIERGDAAVDVEAWRAIAALLAAGSVETDLSWAQLELATSRALISTSEKAAAKPGDWRLVERRDAVASIHARIAWHRWYHSGSRGPSPLKAPQVQQAA